ncbi:MAG: hypothetical protein IJ796_05770 [Lachnospiraceae bacterium]|nr:hypothetical protein [Lachnospiraceae bacterium]
MKGYMTVFLTLIMTVLLSLCLTMIEGARRGAVRMESMVVSHIAVDSIMAEYHRELAKQFNLFAIDDSYGTERASLDNTEEHLAGYLRKNFSGADFFLSSFLYRDFLSLGADKAEIEGALYLTDGDGAVMRKRAYEAIKDDCGIDMLSELMDCAKYIEANGLEEMDLKEDMELLQEQVNHGQQGALEDYERKVAEVHEKAEEESRSEEWENTQIAVIKKPATDMNPTNGKLSLMNPMILYQYVDDVSELSSNTIDRGNLFSSRKKDNMINSGNLELEDGNDFEDAIERFVFQEYLMRYMGRYRHEGTDDALKYQIEYIISGLDSDIDNLIAVVGRIMMIRYAADYIYILTDEEKCEEAEVLGTAISVYTFTEPLAEVYKTLILLMWAGMEAQYDIRCILAGSRIQMIKTAGTWHMTLENSMAGLEKDTTGDKSGLSYDDYLRILMLLMDKELLTSRAADMIEADIRLTPGNEKFRLDACIDTLAADIIVYSKFGYSYEYHIRRKYE